MNTMTRRALAIVMAGSMMAGLLTGCGKKDEGPYAGKGSWTEEQTSDNWIKVTNEGGKTLGYAADSGIKLIEDNGYAFKDLNKNEQLDPYEDWRLDNDTRAENLASMLTVEDVAGLMLFSPHQFAVSAELSEEQMTFLEGGGRCVLSAAADAPTGDQAAWNNSMQAYAEGMGLGIPVTIATDPRTSGVSKWPDNLALAATFDPSIALEQGRQLSKEYRALGLSTLLGPQVDVASEPRWPRMTQTFGEDPALARDMTDAAVSGYQSTFDAEGKDLGWGSESIPAMVKHWVGEGAAQAGREAHAAVGQFNVFPGDQFETSLIPFVDGGFNLKNSSTGTASSVMTSYSIAFDQDERYGELVGSAFSEYKLNLLRDYGFDGVVCTDWGVLTMEAFGSILDTGWGVTDLTPGERAYKALMAGVDQFGGLNDPEPIMEAYDMMIDEMGEEEALARFQESASRLLRNYFNVGLFENAYVDVAAAKDIVNSKEAQEAGRDAQLKGIVMLKNDGAMGPAASDEKPTVYVPMQYTAGVGVQLPVDRKTLSNYFNVVTDTLSGTLTGAPDKDGKATAAYEDIIRATPAELAECDFALVFARGPQTPFDFAGIGYDHENGKYIPVSLQYRPYTADTASVRTQSIAGPMVETEVESVYGVQKVMAPQDTSYFGETCTVKVEKDLDAILYAADNMPEDAKVIVALNNSNPMVMSEFEDKVDGILVGFGVDNALFAEIVSGKVEPSGLLPVQMPADMDTVEANFEDVPRDVICHVDTMGNTYDFGFGMNWSGVISDERTETYNVAPLVTPEAQPVG